jgi:hypothetical protein
LDGSEKLPVKEKAMGQKIKLALLFAAVLCGISCSLPEEPGAGTESRVNTAAGTLILRLPPALPETKADVARHVLSGTVFNRLKYRVTLTGPGPAQTVDPVEGGTSITLSLQAGIWTIRAEAYDPDDPVAPGVTAGYGEATVNIIAGQGVSQKIGIDLDSSYKDTLLMDVYIRNEADLRRYLDNNIITGVTIHLENDINVTGSPIENLYGTLDGHGHTITLNISDDAQYAGLFENNYGTIKNLKLTGAVTGTYSRSWEVAAGAVAACNYSGAIKNVVSTVTVSVTQTGSGNTWAGGIAGENGGTIEDCSSGGDVYLDKTGGSGTPGAGGIAGRNYDGIINRCYAYGNISSTGGSDYTGGIVGTNWNSSATATISNCAALNSKVYNTSTSINYQGRVAGYNNGGTLTNNHAYADMQIGNPSISLATSSEKTATARHGADIAATTLSSSGSNATLWTTDATTLNWPSFQTTPPIEPPDNLTSPWYWNSSKTISIPANTVNTAGVATVYAPSLWFE